MTSLLCALAPLIKNPSYAHDAEHFFEVLFASLSTSWASTAGRLLGSNGKYALIKCLSQGRIAVTNSEKRCVDAFSQEAGTTYESSKVEGFK